MNKKVKTLLIVLGVILLVVAGVAYRYYRSVDDYLASITTTQSSETQPDESKEEPIKFGSEPMVLYISGSDSRTTVSATARSDVNIVAVVNPVTAKILLVNIPRDYYVQLHGTTGTKDKLTHAGVYGIDMSKTTIEDLLDIKIDETLKVGFEAVTTLVDTLDGLDLDIDQDFTSKTDGGCKFTAGVQHVDGRCALAFARERKSYASGDRHRGENQQQVISKILKKIAEPTYLLKLPEILKSAEGLFETSLTKDELIDLIRYEMKNRTNWSVESIALDGTGSYAPTYSMGSRELYVMIPDEATISAAQEKIATYLQTEQKDDLADNSVD